MSLKVGHKKLGGRQKGTGNKSRDEAREMIDKVLKVHGGTSFIFKKLTELGEGIKTLDAEGHVYQKEPNPIALKTLAEYRFGKPAQALDVTSDGEKLSIGIVYGIQTVEEGRKE
jgi:hypothetical protein